MKLHQNVPIFRAVVSNLARRHRKRGDVLEKDYYISLLLNELSQKSVS